MLYFNVWYTFLLNLFVKFQNINSLSIRYNTFYFETFRFLIFIIMHLEHSGQVQGDSILEKKGGEQLRRISNVSLWSLHPDPHCHMILNHTIVFQEGCCQSILSLYRMYSHRLRWHVLSIAPVQHVAVWKQLPHSGVLKKAEERH